jgi:uncharacterized iron-regulated membrane protein
MKKLRYLVRSLHGSIGLMMGLFFVIVGLTGSGIVFHEEIDNVINRSLHTIVVQQSRASIDEILATVQKSHPNLPIELITFPKQIDQSYTINMIDKDRRRLETFVNPYTGVVLGERVWEYSVTGFLYTLHQELFLGHTGLIILIGVGIALFFMSISGMMLWTSWRSLKIRWNTSKSILSFDLHQAIGMISQLFLAVSAITGIVIITLHLFPILDDNKTKSMPILNRSYISTSQLIQTANNAMPGGQIASVYFDQKQPHKLVVTKHFSEQKTGRFDLSNIELDRYSGEVILTDKIIQPSPLFRVLILIANLHFGTFAGLPSRIFYVFVGITPLILLTTGIKMLSHR